MKVFLIVSALCVALVSITALVLCAQRYPCKKLHPHEMVFTGVHYSSISEYLNENRETERVESAETTYVKADFTFANNPYGFSEGTWMSIYANGKKAYEGQFRLAVGQIQIPLGQFDLGMVRFMVTVLHPAENGKYYPFRFGNKSALFWEKEFKTVYAAFFPTNQNIDMIHFFPAKEAVIQQQDVPHTLTRSEKSAPLVFHSRR